MKFKSTVLAAAAIVGLALSGCASSSPPASGETITPAAGEPSTTASAAGTTDAPAEGAEYNEVFHPGEVNWTDEEALVLAQTGQLFPGGPVATTYDGEQYLQAGLHPKDPALEWNDYAVDKSALKDFTKEDILAAQRASLQYVASEGIDGPLNGVEGPGGFHAGIAAEGVPPDPVLAEWRKKIGKYFAARESKKWNETEGYHTLTAYRTEVDPDIDEKRELASYELLNDPEKIRLAYRQLSVAQVEGYEKYKRSEDSSSELTSADPSFVPEPTDPVALAPKLGFSIVADYGYNTLFKEGQFTEPGIALFELVMVEVDGEWLIDSMQVEDLESHEEAENFM